MEKEKGKKAKVDQLVWMPMFSKKVEIKNPIQSYQQRKLINVNLIE